jgi:DNA-binding CsgD family transcriptional regulator
MIFYLHNVLTLTTYTLAAPLTQKQKIVWSLLNKGLSTTAIADKLKTTRQFVNQTKLSAEAKLSTTLLDVAQANDLQVTKLYPKNGILLAYHPALKHKAILAYNTNHGIKVWYWHNNPEEVTDPTFLNQTRQYLIDIIKEKEMEIENAEKIHPAKLAHQIFSKLIPELNCTQ